MGDQAVVEVAARQREVQGNHLTKGDRMNRFHIFISGFNQDTSGDHGIFRIFKDAAVKTKHYDEVRCELRNYNADMEELAQMMVNMAGGSPGDINEVNIYAYSWGGGRGFTQLANALDMRGVIVNHAVLCDPVYWHPFPPLRWWGAKSKSSKIVVPSNVLNVSSVHQVKNWPSGHQLVAADPKKTYIQKRIKVDAGHSSIDDSVDYRRLAMAVYQPSTIGDQDVHV